MDAVEVNTIICPGCEAELDARAEVCDRCGARTSGSNSAASNERLLDRPWLLVVVILHVGLLGIPAYWRTKYSLPVRLLIIMASIVYTIIAVAVIWWGLSQILRLFQ